MLISDQQTAPCRENHFATTVKKTIISELNSMFSEKMLISDEKTVPWPECHKDFTETQAHKYAIKPICGPQTVNPPKGSFHK